MIGEIEGSLKIVGSGEDLYICRSDGVRVWRIDLADVKITARPGDVLRCDASFLVVNNGGDD